MNSIKRDLQPGEKAPLAHQNVRVFPAWYKPYMFNYSGNGYLGVGLMIFVIRNYHYIHCLVGYSYINDIKEAKGRKTRKVWPRSDYSFQEHISELWGKERIASGDPQFTKFLVLKPRAKPHH